MKNRLLAPLLVALFLIAGCSDRGGKAKPVPPPVPVTAAAAQARDIPVTLRMVGRAEAYESVVLRARVDGQIAAVRFTEGQRVKKGEVLVELDPTDFAARLNQAAASAARDEALVAKSRADTARYTALKERKFVSEEKVNDVRTNEAAATANLRASRAAEEVARLQLSYATIRAPIDGIVGARLVFPGSSVKVNDTILAVVNRTQPLLVTFSVPEKHLPRLRASMQSGALKVAVSIPGNDNSPVEGKVHFVDNAVDPATGTIIVKAILSNSDEKFTAGQFLNVSLVLDTLRAAVTVPSEAVQQGTDGSFVYTIKEDETVELRKIDATATHDGRTAVGKGLAIGDLVVTDGQLRLTPGTRIKRADKLESTGAERAPNDGAADRAPPAK